MEKKNEIAVFGGGCFWCTEAVFQMLRGVKSVTSGYAGGTKPNPSYEEVSSGSTGYAEVIKIEYETDKISFRDLLTVFFGSHDPTTVNRQGNDIGTQYRSAIFYTSGKQKGEAEEFIKEINNSNKLGKPIATEVLPFDRFYSAEAYHQNFYKNNPSYGYCEVIINPKLEKVQKEFADLLKSSEELKQ